MGTSVRVLGLTVALLGLAGGWAHGFKRLDTGQRMKPFCLETLEGKRVDLATSLGSKATVVVFWAAWSPRSPELLKDLEALFEKHRASGLGAVAVNVEHAEWDPAQAPKISAVLSDGGVTFPAAVDRDLTVFNEYGVVAVPSAVLLDGTGSVVAVLDGYAQMTRFGFWERVESALGVREPEAVATQTEHQGYTPKGSAARYFRMGEILMRKRMVKRAVQAFGRSLEEDPGYALARERLAEGLEALGRAAEAKETPARDRAVRAAPRDPSGGTRPGVRPQAKISGQP